MERMNTRYAEISTMLNKTIEDAEIKPKSVSPMDLAGQWTAHNDARGYAVIGDPAVRLPIALQDEKATKRFAVEPIELRSGNVPAIPLGEQEPPALAGQDSPVDGPLSGLPPGVKSPLPEALPKAEPPQTVPSAESAMPAEVGIDFGIGDVASKVRDSLAETLRKLSISSFIESLINERRFNLQIVEHKYIPPFEARYMKLVLSDRLREVLKGRGLEFFFNHQVEAIDLIRQGENVVVMTPTASGKSLIYNIPLLESIIENHEQRALYIFPLKGLEQDQVKNLNELYDAIEGIERVSADGAKSSLSFGEIYDGDTTAYRRKKIREAIPNVIFTNPDMLHLAINPFHKKWETLFKNVKFI